MSDMNCEEFWNTAPSRGLDGGHAAHLRDCAACAGQWDAESRLSAGLRAMASVSKNVGAPARVEFRLVQAFRQYNGLMPDRRRKVTPRQPWLAALAWTAAAAALAVGLLLVRAPQPQQAKPGKAPKVQLVESPLIDDAAYVENTDAETEEGDVVRLEVPRSAMMALGYDVSPERAAESVEAEVTLGLDGQARAVRFLEE